FYSVQTRCQPPLSTAFDPPDRSANRAIPPPCQPGAFYVNPPSVQAFNLANFLIYKRFCRRPAPEKVRIIGTSDLTSTAIGRFLGTGYCPRSHLYIEGSNAGPLNSSMLSSNYPAQPLHWPPYSIARRTLCRLFPRNPLTCFSSLPG